MATTLMKTTTIMTMVLVGLVAQTLSTRLSTNVKAKDLLRRQRRQVTEEPRNIECVDMVAEEGHYWHTSAGSDVVCGLYVIGNVDALVQLEITHFNVGCEDQGLMAVVDGWELQGDLFPSPEDLEGGLEAQYRTYCGEASPPPVFVSSQNVALVQFRTPRAGQGFRVRVRFLRNPEPCNVLAPNGVNTFTLRNYGSSRNCTTLILYPVNVHLLNADVKATSPFLPTRRDLTSGLSVNCDGPAGADYTAFAFGVGLDTAFFNVRMAFCGRRIKAARHPLTLGCPSSALRLVSSGLYDNTLTVETSQPPAQQMEAFLLRYPQCALDN
ncbi:corticotropin-releasing factor-binding protein-like [Babylonia areolata]|uniref:corticotropin-releasing factor-binding protein-like n=1 Tax=Babylonia areolata TaxID=304850 RepID=UPI003FD1C7AB